MIGERRIGVAFLECVELPVLKVPESRREAFADQSEQSKDMIAGAASVGEVFLDVERSVLVEQPVEHIGCLALGGTDRQNAEVAVLIGQMAVELRAGLAAVVQIDITAFCGSVACSEELAIGRGRSSVAPELGTRVLGVCVGDACLRRTIGF